jgi:nucleoside-diphosphate-sugar epimerase
MRVGLTGSGGFVGRALLNLLRTTSFDAVQIKLPKSSKVFDRSVLTDLLADLSLDALVHMAAIRHPANEYELAVNARLPGLLKEVMAQFFPVARFVHISSINTVLSERKDSYSKSKRLAELALEDSGAIIIRPGVIWSWKPDAGGDAERMRNYLARPLPFHPIPFPGQSYRPILVEDFADRIVDLLTEKNPPSVINALGDKSVSIWELANIMSSNAGVRLLPIPTAFLEKLLPGAILQHLPVALRSADLSTPNEFFRQPAEVTWQIPFSTPITNNFAA